MNLITHQKTWRICRRVEELV